MALDEQSQVKHRSSAGGTGRRMPVIGVMEYKPRVEIGGRMRARAGIIRGAVVAALVFTSRTTLCQEAEKNDSALATALRAKHIGLATAITSAASKGKPISAKYEYEDGKLQLSVYTLKDQQFYEVIVNHHTAKIAKTEKITAGDDLKAAQDQSAALATVYASLGSAVRKAVRKNRDYEAVSATPALQSARALVTIRLRKGKEFKTVTEPLT
jgi:hypothetical protein